MKRIAACVAVIAAAGVISSTQGCRLRTVEPDEYQPQVSGHLNPVEARQLVTLLLARHGIKLAYNAELDLRGVKIHADGFDRNLHIGYVYLIAPAPGTKLNFEIQSRPTPEQAKVLEKIEKTEHTYIAWIDEGTQESITAQIEAFTERLYKAGALAKPREPKRDEDTQAAKDGKETKDGADAKKDEGKKEEPREDEPKKKEKSKVMQMIEDESEKKDDD
ncbi:MAG: hypothetical protein HY897_15655 [Deltaproteobacteria bacterium]|nr:hypothetical protein [Deltaproteobacteria bacterium]